MGCTDTFLTNDSQQDRPIRLGGLPSVQPQSKRSGAHGIGSTRIPQRRTRTCTRRIVLGALHAFTMQRNVDWPLFDNALRADRCMTSSGGQPLKAAGGDGRQCTIPVIRDDKENEHTTSMDKASCFGRHFSAKCSLKEDLHQSDLPHFPRRCDTVLSQVRFRPTTVRRYLKGLDVSKATGPDGIPARVLKQCAAELSQPLSQLFSLCFQHGTQPSLWKTANVVPIHKKRSRTAVQNYHPVSLLSVLSKVMEKVVNRRIMTNLEKENLLSKHQFGFRTGLGTADLLTSLNHQWLSCINTGGAVRVLAVDIAGAFDRVSHVGVLHKIRSYGLDGTLH